MVRKRLISNFAGIFRSKVYFFLKKSVWKYLIFSFILGYFKPLDEMNPIVSALIYFFGINLILWPLQYLSAKAFAKTINFDATVEFSETEIKIEHHNKNLNETKDWNWIKKIEINKDRIWLTLNQAKPFGLSILKSTLENAEIELFAKMKKMKNDH